MSGRIAIDASVAVALLVQTHDDHDAVAAWCAGREIALCGHAVAEAYSVLTRLPAQLRLSADEAAIALTEGFTLPVVLRPRVAAKLPATLAGFGITGGAVYDAMVGLAAVGAGLPLATRDERARPTYEAVGAEVHVVA